MDNSGYRCLCVFSGVLPTPDSEEQFEYWIEQARLMVEEGDLSTKEKRRRIIESLKGPALEVVKAAHIADENVGPAECLNALESAFGMAETGEDLYFSFCLMQQKQGEKLSDFLQRLEQVLSKVIKRSGIMAAEANKARLEQLIRGAVASDLMLVQLRLRKRRSNPPSFLDLLSEIHVEEEIEASWSKLKASVHTVSTDKESDIRSKDIQVLKNEIKELKSMVAAIAVATSKVTMENAVTKTKVPTPEPVSYPELASLKRQVMRLEQKLDLEKSSCCLTGRHHPGCPKEK